MQRAKHRAAGTGADVLATTFIERLAATAAPVRSAPGTASRVPERPSVGMRGCLSSFRRCQCARSPSEPLWA